MAEEFTAEPSTKKTREGDRTGEHRVMRGGSAWNDAQRARSAYRNRRRPANRNDNQGFRVAFPASSNPEMNFASR